MVCDASVKVCLNCLKVCDASLKVCDASVKVCLYCLKVCDASLKVCLNCLKVCLKGRNGLKVCDVASRYASKALWYVMRASRDASFIESFCGRHFWQ